MLKICSTNPNYTNGQIQTVFDFLVKVAQKQGITHYKETGALVGLEAHNPILWQMLGEISTYTYRNYGVFLSVLVVNYESGHPGGSFFDLVASLQGTKVKDKLKFFCEEYRRCHKTNW